MKALIGRDSSPARERAPSPIVPATPQSISQIDRSTNENQLEHGNEQLGTSILELKRAIELSGARLWALEEQGKAAADRLKVTEDLFKVAADRLKATEDRLKATEDRFKTIEDRLLLMQSQSTQPSRTLETLSMGDGGSNSVVRPGSSQPPLDYAILLNTFATPAGALSSFPAYGNGSSC